MARYDDMIETVIERAGGSAALQAVGWQQLVDLIARSPLEPASAETAYRALEDWRPSASAARRARTCATVADRAMPPRLFEHLALDDPAIAAPLLVASPASDDTILALLPHLSGPARAQLRNRADVSDTLERALDAYGPADRALGSRSIPLPSVVPSPADDTRPTSIRALVDRIERFRQGGPRRMAAREVGTTAPSTDAETPRRFAFETDRAGVVRWTDARHRGAIFGLSLADAGGGAGVADETADRHARRSPLVGDRLTLPPGSPFSGNWRIDAHPVFAVLDGRFRGYAGHAMRDDGLAARAMPSGSDLSNDVRQLVHELKTPLNAIIGFSDLIGEQLLGPVPLAYREEAATIRDRGLAVLASIEDVDLSARLDNGSGERPAGSPDGASNLPVAVADEVARLERDGERRRFAVRLGDERWVGLDVEELSRMVSRLLSGLAAAAGPDERLLVTTSGRKRPRLRIATPRALASLNPDDLSALRLPENLGEASGPLLGLTFTLRLVRRLAEQAGGELRAEPAEFTLSLPPAMQDRAERRQ